MNEFFLHLQQAILQLLMKSADTWDSQKMFRLKNVSKYFVIK